MVIKEIIGGITAFFGILLFLKVMFLLPSITAGNTEALEQGVTLAAEASIPWWLGLLGWLAGLGTFGALMIIFLVYCLAKAGEIR